MECACISASIDDAAEVLSRKKITAKKHHKCCECGIQIEPGSQYWYEKIICDGYHDRYKTCLDCMSVREHLFCDFYYEMIWETVREFIEEHPEDLPWAKISRLTPVARDKVCAIIEEAWEAADDMD